MLDWVTNTPLSILTCQKSGAFCLLGYVQLCSSVIKCSPFYQKKIAKRHIYAFLIVREAILRVSKKAQNTQFQKKELWDKSLKNAR